MDRRCSHDHYGLRVGWLLAVALGVLLGIYVASCGEDNKPEAQDRELHFFQTNPPCKNALAAYLVVAGRLYTTEMHRVYVCGYEVK